MACFKPISLYLALFSLLYDLTLHPTHGQLLPVTDNQQKTYIVRVVKHEEAEHLSNEDLESGYKSFLPNTTLDSGAPRLVYSYRHAISGFAARLTPKEVKAMETNDGFLYARPEKFYQLQTTYTHEFLGLSQPFGGAWDGTMYGEGIVIGVIDSGILPTHPSFSASQMPPPPPKWKGNCSTAGFKCNYKIIGANGFLNGTNPSPIDDNGHGTHVASTAAGVFVNGANVLGNARGTASGMAPKAHLAIYKVCFTGRCSEADTLAAIDQAIMDGVDVISMSLGPTGIYNEKLYEDGVAQGSFAAFNKGISTCTAAGNAGPDKSTLGHSAPWVLTVGASSTDRRVEAIVKLGNGMELHGQTAFQPSVFNSSAFLTIEFPGRYGAQARLYCLNGSLDHIDVRGKVVLCMSGQIGNIEKGKIVYAAGGAAIIIMNLPQQGNTGFSEAHILPAAHVSFLDGEKMRNFVYSNSTPTAAIKFKHTQFGSRPAPAVTSFSSRGPSEMNGGIIKPDVLAPGVNILAAWPFGVGPRPLPFDTKTFNFQSGTSMAAPHVSGIIALLKYKHNQWSPAAIQSAIITSAQNLDLDGNAIKDEDSNMTANIYATGAGQVNPAGAFDPGLVYELTDDDYKGYLCSLGYNQTEIYWTIGKLVQCSNAQPVSSMDNWQVSSMLSPSQLNHPAITVSLSSALPTQTVTRAVTNVGDAHEVYNARIREPPGVDIRLSTYQLTFTRPLEVKSFNVTFIRMRNHRAEGPFGGQVAWVSDKHVVASPIAAIFS